MKGRLKCWRPATGPRLLGVALLAVCAAAADDRSHGGQVFLKGTVRDFRERMDDGGHPDFEREPDHGFHLYMGNVAPYLGDDGKPVFTGEGYEVTEQWKDASGRNISSHVSTKYPKTGDVGGRRGEADRGGVQSGRSFDLWFRDAPGINASVQTSITLVGGQEDGTYVFDDQLDEEYQELGGFFPLDDLLFGNSGGEPDHNFHFTFEAHAEFLYDGFAGQFIEVLGDDDVWLFVNGELVIDLGGVHFAKEQHIDLDRLRLQHGRVYRLDLFFAERHRENSRLRLVTNLQNLRSVRLEAASADRP